MKKIVSIALIAAGCSVYGVEEKKPRPSLFLSQEESEQHLKEQVERLQSNISQQNQESEESFDQSLEHVRSRRTHSYLVDEALDFTKDALACYTTSYIIANVLLKKDIPQKNLALMGIAGALDLRLPRWIRFMLDMVI